MPRSISMARGKGKIKHNNRVFFSPNVDNNRVKDNIILKQENLSEAYEKIFGNAVTDYNKNQKRADRKIKDYFEKLFGKHNDDTILKNDNKQQSFYEYVVGVGSMIDTALVDSVLKDGTKIAANPKDAEIAAQCLAEYMLGNEKIGVQSFAARNPNFYVFNAVIHMDEKTPHLHYDIIPFADGFKKGMTRQQGLSKALEAMGYGNGKDAIKNFTESERGIFQKICEAHEFEIEPPKKGRGFTIPTKIMETYYPVVQDNERQIAEQERQIKANISTISEQEVKIMDNSAKIDKQNKKIVAELPPRPDFLNPPKEPELGYIFSYEDQKKRKKEYAQEMKEYKAELRKVEKHNKAVPNEQAEWDNKYLPIIEAERLSKEADEKLSIAKSIASKNAECKAELERQEQRIKDEISKGINEGLSADRRAIELLERRTLAIQTRAKVNKTFQQKYNRIFDQLYQNERSSQHDYTPLEAEPNRDFSSKPERNERE